VPRFPHLYGGDSNNIYSIGLSWQLRQLIHRKNFKFSSQAWRLTLVIPAM
jgi:hypothetical protein